MKVIINYTVYLGECSIDDYLSYVRNLHQEIVNEIGYELNMATCGVHRNASRGHIHYHTVNEFEIDEKKKIKKYKILNDKIKRLKCYKEQTVVHPRFVIPEVKITFNYDDDTDYNEMKSLAYPMKEYGTNQDMYKDIDVDDTTNIGQSKLEELRKYANDIYRQKLNEQAKQQAKDDKKKKCKQDLYTYLDSVIVTTNIPHYHGEVESIVRFTVKQMLVFYKSNNQNFSIHQLKNVAINYLYFSGIIDERDIIVYAQI